MRNEVILDNNLNVMLMMQDNSIDLVYIDPPFGTGEIQTTATLGNNEGLGSKDYSDKMIGEEYVRWLYLRT